MSSLIRATNLWGYEELVRRLGADPAPFLAEASIPEISERPDDSFVPFRRQAQLLEISARRLACPDFGLRLARWQGLEMLGAIAVIARSTSTVLGAFAAIANYLYIHSPALELKRAASESDDRLRFEYQITELSLGRTVQAYELSMANGMEILRLLAGPRVRPLYMSFMHAQVAEDEAYHRTFGCPVQFEQPWCGLELSASVGAQSIDSADPQTQQLAEAYLAARYPSHTELMSVRVADLIRRLLPTGQCNAETIADSLAMHPRTLQRHLEAEGEQYADLLARERRSLAERYLAESGLHLSQIAGLLGYAEQSSFNRACQRWFGTTPRRYRLQLQQSRN